MTIKASGSSVKANSDGAERSSGESDEQQRLATIFFGSLSDPRREQRHDKLRHNNQGRYDGVPPGACPS